MILFEIDLYVYVCPFFSPSTNVSETLRSQNGHFVTWGS